MLNDEERKDLIHYRIEKAYKVLDEARDNAKLGHWNLTGTGTGTLCNTELPTGS